MMLGQALLDVKNLSLGVTLVLYSMSITEWCNKYMYYILYDERRDVFRTNFVITSYNTQCGVPE